MPESALLIKKLSDLTLVLSILSMALVALALMDCLFIYRRMTTYLKRIRKKQ